MSDQSIEGLRNAARRVFWEAKNIEGTTDEARIKIVEQAVDLIKHYHSNRFFNLRRDPSEREPSEGLIGEALSKAANKQEWEEAFDMGADCAVDLICIILAHLQQKRCS